MKSHFLSFILLTIWGITATTAVADSAMLSCTVDVAAKFKDDYRDIKKGEKISIVYRFTIKTIHHGAFHPLPDYENSVEIVQNGSAIAGGMKLNYVHIVNDSGSSGNRYDNITISTTNRKFKWGHLAGIDYTDVGSNSIVTLNLRSSDLSTLKTNEFVQDESIWNSFDSEYPNTGLILASPVDPPGPIGIWALEPTNISITCNDIQANQCDTWGAGNRIWDITDSLFGAKPNDEIDDTTAISNAIKHSCHGDTLYIPQGRFNIRNPIKVNKHINIQGAGQGSVIFQTDDTKDVLVLGSSACPQECLSTITIRDITLVAKNKNEQVSDTALLRLHKVHRSLFQNIVLQGANTGISIAGSLENKFDHIVGGTNGRRHPIPICITPNDEETFRCHTKQWVSMKSEGSVSSNSNVFNNLILEGGVNGILFEDSKGQGSFRIYGGTIQTSGNRVPNNSPKKPAIPKAGIAIRIINNSHPIVLSGMHIEANDVHIEGGRHIQLEHSLLVPSDSAPHLGGTLVVKDSSNGINSRSVSVVNSVVDRLYIGKNSVRTRLVNLTNGYIDTIVEDEAVDTFYQNVSGNSALPGKSTIGYGISNPDFSATGNRISIKGKLEEQ